MLGNSVGEGKTGAGVITGVVMVVVVDDDVVVVVVVVDVSPAFEGEEVTGARVGYGVTAFLLGEVVGGFDVGDFLVGRIVGRVVGRLVD